MRDDTEEGLGLSVREAAERFIGDPRSGMVARPTIVMVVEKTIERARELQSTCEAMLKLVSFHSQQADRLIADAEVLVPKDLPLADQMELLDLLELKELIHLFELVALEAASFRGSRPSVVLVSWLRRALQTRPVTWQDVALLQETARQRAAQHQELDDA